MFTNGIQSIMEKGVYESYLNRLDARALLEHYGARNQTEQVNVKDGTTEIVHSCLIDRVYPHHSNGDTNPSASCNVDKRKYVCYSLGMGCDLFHLVMKLEGRESLAESMSLVAQFLTGATVSARRFSDELEKAFAKTNVYDLGFNEIDPQILKSFDYPHQYWNERGITSEAQMKLHLGFDPDTKRLVFPHFVNDKLVGWQKRVVPGETIKDLDAKYKNSPGFPKNDTVYNLDAARAHPTVIVVESPMSVAKAVGWGIPNVVSTFGAKVGQPQIDALASFEKVYVWMDRDAAGVKAEQKLVTGLYRHTKVMVVTPEWGKDMADYTEDEALEKLHDATPAALRLGKYFTRRF